MTFLQMSINSTWIKDYWFTADLTSKNITLVKYLIQSRYWKFLKLILFCQYLKEKLILPVKNFFHHFIFLFYLRMNIVGVNWFDFDIFFSTCQTFVLAEIRHVVGIIFLLIIDLRGQFIIYLEKVWFFYCFLMLLEIRWHFIVLRFQVQVDFRVLQIRDF